MLGCSHTTIMTRTVLVYIKNFDFLLLGLRSIPALIFCLSKNMIVLSGVIILVETDSRCVTIYVVKWIRFFTFTSFLQTIMV